MLLIVGLGNPGENHLMTRHNLGFLVLDAFAKIVNAPPFKREKECLVSKISFLSPPLLLVKPQTYMNLSGEALLSCLRFYNLIPLEPENLLLIHDDMDQEYGKLLYQKGRGAGGHNGVKNVQEHLRTKEHYRLRVGIGRAKEKYAPHVLSPFSKTEQKDLPSLLSFVCESLDCFIKKGYAFTASQFNRKTSI